MYQKKKWKEMVILMLPIMTLMRLATTACILATVPKLTLFIASCVTSTDPVVSQAVAKGPFADKFVRRSLRERISSESGANDGFGFPILMLTTHLIRHAEGSEVHADVTTLHEVLFLMGTSGAIGTDDLLSCFVAGSAINWDGKYLAEAQKRHDEVNANIDVLLNFGGFIYLGTIIPRSDFNSDITGISIGRLFGLDALILVLRRIPAVLLTYKLMPVTSFPQSPKQQAIAK
ncbi:sodium/hydrogen exchanger family protein [Colletotrichum orchidophilum]|uniref:Sodium/hydrogen exchanger family protein n=1 Tax=Colletotrichum orchidophilum TaxID=1209926 RepID=A0A1G4B408_9PEZI|nr:sodium/hydrogen exchanger family protein [Colletotrichum orchidophilum]OHE96022.1 sodium/hydrogen exchanger family protein [Colletotrichum orchidophilum]